jgi:hypothetical protein
MEEQRQGDEEEVFFEEKEERYSVFIEWPQ